MQKNSRFLLICLLASFGLTTGCAETTNDDASGLNTNNANEEIPTLANLDSLIAGAPKNDSLPEEGKADAVYPAKFDLVASQSPVKNQGGRGVCSIFSTVALMEHLYILEGTVADPDFSEQYVQWSSKFEAGHYPNTDGSNAQQNIDTINRFGAVTEQDWKYQSTAWNTSNNPACTGDAAKRPTECHTNGQPPQSALDAPKYKLPAGRWVSTRTKDIKAFLTNNKQALVIGGTFFYQAWNHGGSPLPVNQQYKREGYILYPNETDKVKSLESRAGHSILLVGWDDDLEVQRLDEKGQKMVDANGKPVMEKGFFIIKNSWGTGSFGVNNKHGDGYGYISMKYVEEYKTAYGSGLPVIAPPTPKICGKDLSCEDKSCLDAPVCKATGETATFGNDDEVAIPDNNAKGITSVIKVPAQSGVLYGVTVTALISHSFVGDLELVLVHPDGSQAVLRKADGKPGNDFDETFRVESFNAKSLGGDWKLIVRDTSSLNKGELLMWELSLTK